jgi:hypothetical protein
MTAALAIIVVGLALRPATSGIGTTGPVSAAADDGVFRLELTTPRATYEPGYAIAPVARVTYLGPDPAIAVTHSHSQLVFQVQEVDGTRQMEGGSRLSCESTNLVKGEPLAIPFSKSGSRTDDPTQGFDQAWYEDPTLTLPIGTWRITALMGFGIGECGVGSHVLQVSNVIRVVAPTGDGPPIDRAEDSLFRLELTTPRRIYAPTDAIEPMATVTLLGPAAELPIYRAGSIVGFEIEEVGGDRTLYPGIQPVCASDVVRRDTPLTIPYTKSGPIGGAFDQAWFDDPVLRLPAGTWRIRAYTTISADDGPAPSDGSFTCGTRGHGLDVAIVITVVGDNAPSPSASVRPSPTATLGSPEPTANLDPVSKSVDDAAFQLTLTTPHGTYGPNDVIEPNATVTYLGPSGKTSMFHGSSPVGFLIDEIGGTRRMDGGMDLPCLQTTATQGVPLSYPFEKAGTTEHGFDAVWYQDPALHLPTGVWRIRAYLDIDVTDGTMTCGGIHHHLEVENVITVR